MSLSLNIEITRRTIQCHQIITPDSYVVLNEARLAALEHPKSRGRVLSLLQQKLFQINVL